MPHLPNNSHRNKRPPKERKLHSEHAFYVSKAWRQTRLFYLADNPLCEVHQYAGQVVEATLVDHMIPHRTDVGGAKLNADNLCAMCKDCHDYKSSLESANPVLVAWEYAQGGKVPKDREQLLKHMVFKIGLEIKQIR